MKKILLLSFVLYCTVTLINAQTLVVPSGTVGNSGNSYVGIGTSPKIKLHIDGGTDAGAFKTAGYFAIGSVTNRHILMDNNEIMCKQSNAPALLHLQTDGGAIFIHYSLDESKRVVINDDGDVGIGTASPDYKLDVDGTFHVSGKASIGSNADAETHNYELNLLQENSKIAFGDNNPIGYANGGVNCFIGEYGILGAKVDSDILQIHGKNGIYFSNGSKGNNVVFKIGSDGITYAKEIVVTNSNWPDFVFAPEYKLRTLNEVASFIEKNNHLPDVPSEKEVLENGISLGEMDATLLQKIEELTLYMIEQEKRIEELENNK